MTVVQVNHVTKTYADKTAINDLSFSVAPGEILGLIGPNGAGKSTTIKIILDFIKPDSGEVFLFDHPWHEALKDQVGYLPEERGLYKKMRAMDLILYMASLKSMDQYAAKEKAHALLDQTKMLSHQNKKIEAMSKGMGQIIQLIISIIHDPELIILDEPFSGLDPVNTDLLKKIIEKLKHQGKTIILSTHQMNEVEALCDRILMIHNGSAVLYGDLGEIKSGYQNHSVLVDVQEGIGDIQGVIEKRDRKGSIELILDKNTAPQCVLEALVKERKTIKRFEAAGLTLNEIFLEVVGNAHK